MTHQVITHAAEQGWTIARLIEVANLFGYQLDLVTIDTGGPLPPTKFPVHIDKPELPGFMKDAFANVLDGIQKAQEDFNATVRVETIGPYATTSDQLDLGLETKPTRRAPQKWADDEIAKLTELAKADTGIDDIATALDRSVSSVTRKLYKLGLMNNGPRGQRVLDTTAPRAARAWAPDEDEFLIAARRRGLTFAYIANSLGRSKNAAASRWTTLRNLNDPRITDTTES